MRAKLILPRFVLVTEADEDDWRFVITAALAGQLRNLLQVPVALVVRQPCNLERMVALEQTVGVVVDRFAGPAQ